MICHSAGSRHTHGICSCRHRHKSEKWTGVVTYIQEGDAGRLPRISLKVIVSPRPTWTAESSTYKTQHKKTKPDSGRNLLSRLKLELACFWVVLMDFFILRRFSTWSLDLCSRGRLFHAAQTKHLSWLLLLSLKGD